MSRDYTNYIMLSGVLDNLPDSDPLVKQFAQKLLKPTIKIGSEDCGTQLGKKVDLNFDIEGKIELATDVPLTRQRIEYLLGQGYLSIYLRTLDTCTAPEGICRSCYSASYGATTADRVVVSPSSTLPYLSYLAKSYSGSLLGVKNLETGLLPVRHSLLQEIILDNELNFIVERVCSLPNIPSTYPEYINNIQDKLEKALFVIILYAVFTQVS